MLINKFRKNSTIRLFLILLILAIFLFLNSSTAISQNNAEEEKPYFEYFHLAYEECQSCSNTKPVIENIEEKYQNDIKFRDIYIGHELPIAVISTNSSYTFISTQNFTYENISNEISKYDLNTTDVYLEFLYLENYGTVEEKKQIINAINQSFKDNVTIQQYILFEGQGLPIAVIKSPDQIDYEIFNYNINLHTIEQSKLEERINNYLQNEIYIICYYSPVCGDCDEKREIVQTVQSEYQDNPNIIFQYKDISIYRSEYLEYLEKYAEAVPFVIVLDGSKESIIPSNDITVENIRLAIEGSPPVENKDYIVIDFGVWEVKIDKGDFSLPVLTVVLAGLDSFNPCAFFILIFLLNLLIYARSRKRMILIGGVFIFFSGLLYMLFMFIMYETLIAIQTTGNIALISVIVGLIILPMGLLNIKDFFFFKKGASLSIPDSKKPKIFKQMRGLVKNPKVGATLIGTIFLAITVNFYELLCTLGLPFAFTHELARQSIERGSSSYYMYILFYNIVYIIPLLIIVLIFVFTLGRRKLNEWHGRVMKLMSGIMLTSFGTIFLTNYKLLENIITPILLLLFSLLGALIISWFYKKYKPVQDGS